MINFYGDIKNVNLD